MSSRTGDEEMPRETKEVMAPVNCRVPPSTAPRCQSKTEEVLGLELQGLSSRVYPATAARAAVGNATRVFR
jgi:hypothetical protein